MNSSRRQFLLGAAAVAVRFDSGREPRSFKPESIAQDFEIKVGYTSAAWGDQTEQAIGEISDLGYQGIQIHEGVYRKYASRTGEFKSLMFAKKLTVVSLSTGGLTSNSNSEKQEIADRVAMAKWLKDVGGLYLQVTDGARAKQGVNDHDDYKKMSRRLTEIGKRSFSEHGIRVGYQNQIGSLGERRDEFDRILEAADSKSVWALVDLAHMQAAGADPVRMTRDYLNRMVCPIFRDVLIPKSQTSLDGRTAKPKYDFVDLGMGVVNTPAALQIMKDFRYRGWVLVGLDRAINGRTPKESAVTNKRFVEEKLKLKV
jgi:sugar phosphate isomerase/epimerase